MKFPETFCECQLFHKNEFPWKFEITLLYIVPFWRLYVYLTKQCSRTHIPSLLSYASMTSQNQLMNRHSCIYVWCMRPLYLGNPLHVMYRYIHCTIMRYSTCIVSHVHVIYTLNSTVHTAVQCLGDNEDCPLLALYVSLSLLAGRWRQTNVKQWYGRSPLGVQVHTWMCIRECGSTLY